MWAEMEYNNLFAVLKQEYKPNELYIALGYQIFVLKANKLDKSKDKNDDVSSPSVEGKFVVSWFSDN